MTFFYLYSILSYSQDLCDFCEKQYRLSTQTEYYKPLLKNLLDENYKRHKKNNRTYLIYPCHETTFRNRVFVEYTTIKVNYYICSLCSLLYLFNKKIYLVSLSKEKLTMLMKSTPIQCHEKIKEIQQQYNIDECIQSES